MLALHLRWTIIFMKLRLSDLKVERSIVGDLTEQATFYLKLMTGDSDTEALKLLEADYPAYVMFLNLYDESPATLLTPGQGIIGIDEDNQLHYSQIAFGLMEDDGRISFQQNIQKLIVTATP